MVVLSGALSVYDSLPAKSYVILDGALIDSGDAKSRALTNIGIQPIIYRIMCGVLGETAREYAGSEKNRTGFPYIPSKNAEKYKKVRG